MVFLSKVLLAALVIAFASWLSGKKPELSGPCPTLLKLHPPNWSMISKGHSIALKRSRKLCLKP